MPRVSKQTITYCNHVDCFTLYIGILLSVYGSRDGEQTTPSSTISSSLADTFYYLKCSENEKKRVLVVSRKHTRFRGHHSLVPSLQSILIPALIPCLDYISLLYMILPECQFHMHVFHWRHSQRWQSLTSYIIKGAWKSLYALVQAYISCKYT